MHDKQKAACYPAGPAAVIDQQFDAEQGKAVPDSPGRTALIFPCRNNYVLFNGRLGHGVLGSSSNKPRMTMLINWWAEKPQVTVLLLLYFSSHNCNLASHCLDLPLHSVDLPTHNLTLPAHCLSICFGNAQRNYDHCDRKIRS